MNFNRTIVVGGHYVNVVEAPQGDLRSEQYCGRWAPLSNTITIAAEAPPSRKLEILWHEIIHALLSPISSKGEEKFVSVAAEQLIGFFRCNPDVVADMYQTFQEEEQNVRQPKPAPESQPAGRRKPRRRKSRK